MLSLGGQHATLSGAEAHVLGVVGTIRDHRYFMDSAEDVHFQLGADFG